MHLLKAVFIVVASIISISTLASDDIFVYPNKGQSQQQQSQERYECHVWAANQSGFDPTAYYASAPAPMPVGSSGPGHYPHRQGMDPIRGAAGGAALGALGSAIGGDAGKGAAIGASVGALAGIISTADREHKRKTNYASSYTHHSQRAVEFEQDRTNYKRAISACLEAKDYTVK
jgi:hypothetical protein